MTREQIVLLSEMDVGGWAECYAARPYGHHKAGVYPLFCDVLACLASRARVLDIGAGPGHLAYEYSKAHPGSEIQFVLLDASAKLLQIAEVRAKSQKKEVETVNRSFNAPGWERGLGKFDAIVSNNALFHVRPRKLGPFYRKCFALLKKDALLLNQQSFAFEGKKSPYGKDRFSEFMRSLPKAILPTAPKTPEAEKERLEKEWREMLSKHGAAVAEAEAAGISFAREETGYRFLTVEKHLECMRRAGFSSGCIWRKREFAVVLGVRGKPLATRTSG